MSWGKFGVLMALLAAFVGLVIWSLPGIYAAQESEHGFALLYELVFVGLIGGLLAFIAWRVVFPGEGES